MYYVYIVCSSNYRKFPQKVRLLDSIIIIISDACSLNPGDDDSHLYIVLGNEILKCNFSVRGMKAIADLECLRILVGEVCCNNN